MVFSLEKCETSNLMGNLGNQALDRGSFDLKYLKFMCYVKMCIIYIHKECSREGINEARKWKHTLQ